MSGVDEGRRMYDDTHPRRDEEPPGGTGEPSYRSDREAKWNDGMTSGREGGGELPEWAYPSTLQKSGTDFFAARRHDADDEGEGIKAGRAMFAESHPRRMADEPSGG